MKSSRSNCLPEKHVRIRYTTRLSVKGQKNIYYANSDYKKAGVFISISEKKNTTKKTTSDKETFYSDKNVNMSGRYIIMKKYTPKSRASKIHEAKLTEIDNLVKQTI